MRALKFVSIVIGLIAYGSLALASAKSDGPVFQPGSMADGAPTELMHWGKIVGQWYCEEEGLKQDGSGWQSAGNSDWDFFWAYNGWGIQDNYTSPSLNQALEDESKRQRGINLRIYNPAEKKWVLTWLTVASKKSLAISALSTDEQVVMLTDEPNAQGQHTRYTFFAMTESNFEWKMELSSDQESWREVYRIHATKKQH